MTKLLPAPIQKKRNLLEIVSSTKYQVLPTFDQEVPHTITISKEPEHNSEHRLSLTYRRREYLMKQPIKNKKAQQLFHKARIKLRGLLLWKKIIEDIHEYGISSHTIGQGVFTINANVCVRSFDTNNETVIEHGRWEEYLFFPDMTFKKYWNFLIILLIFYVFIGMPWVTAFQDEQPWTNLFIFEVVVDFLFFLDILITFNSAYVDSNKVLVANRKKIVMNYLKGMFIIDLFSVFPFYMFDTTSSRPNAYVRMIRITKIIRIFRASKILKIIEHFSDSDTMEYWQDLMLNYQGTSRLIATIFVILIMAHINACLWYFFAKIDDFSPDTWITRGGFEDDSELMLYLRALYFTFTVVTTVGFGDIHANTITEMIICMILMLFGIGFYSFLVGTLSSVITSIDAKAIKVNAKLSLIDKFAIDCMLPESITRSMKRFSKNNGENEIMEDERRIELISQMPKNFRYDIAMGMHNELPKKIFFFQEQDAALIVDIVPRLNMMILIKNEFAYKKGEHPTGVYFIGQGRVSFLYSQSLISFKTMIAGSYFGEIELIEKTPRKFSAVADCNCELLIMSEHLLQIFLEKFPDSAAKFRKLAQIKSMRNNENLQEIIDVLEVVEIRKEIELDKLCGKKRIKNKGGLKAKVDRLRDTITHKFGEKSRSFNMVTAQHLTQVEEELKALTKTINELRRRK